MKHFPYPDKPLKNIKEVKSHVVELVYNALYWMKIDGYQWTPLTPGDNTFSEQEGASFVVTTDYPYKKFSISIQQDSITKMIAADKKSAVWRNIEKSIMHEVFHVLLHRLVAIAEKRFVNQSEIIDHEEYLVDHLVSVFYPCMEEHRKNKK